MIHSQGLTFVQWMLGFCQDEDPATLQRHRFPSKVREPPGCALIDSCIDSEPAAAALRA